ncbi:NAD(P)H dehydrogenase [Tribonema minus]|uniref:NAD(P)H dehydrogenase n=1 Tax=Tribonema minus TaxID=303371 RepID=A0A835ZJZ3_9STRA|nr:NAD(P)H dehydrogenase [Tribonema minus]
MLFGLQQAVINAAFRPLRSLPGPFSLALNKCSCHFPPARNADGGEQRVLLLYAHPVHEGSSYSCALRDAVVSALKDRGHDVRVADLYAEGFEAALSAEELRTYMTAYREGALAPAVAAHVESLRWAQGLVFVYPTWWYTPPAILKGWFDRCLCPGATFDMPDGTTPTNPNTGVISRLTNIKRIGVVSTYGNQWQHVQYVGDPGRRLISRGLRAICHPDCSVLWLGLHGVETCAQERRSAFLEHVRQEFSWF